MPEDLIATELRHVISTTMLAHPRSHQSAIGPSELGTPCLRKLAHRIAGTTPVNRSAAWRTAVGTAVHAWLADAFDTANCELVAAGLGDRWLVERRVTVGTIGGVPIEGSADLFDTATGTVIDWKVVGLTSLRAARMIGPKPQYRTQIHCYARGFAAQGHHVERVAIMWLPQSGELAQAEYWSEPYDETVALEGLARAHSLNMALNLPGPSVIPFLPAVDDYCGTCPYHLAGARSDATDVCRGATTERETVGIQR